MATLLPLLSVAITKVVPIPLWYYAMIVSGGNLGVDGHVFHCLKFKFRLNAKLEFLTGQLLSLLLQSHCRCLLASMVFRPISASSAKPFPTAVLFYYIQDCANDRMQ
ncbi:MAG: hypothetical protein LUD00_13950 [Prevotellaceae bacterium]|nr:hypothetical protein [Prevotellaceae bacterium]